jgi:spore maturation protein A
MVFGVVFAIFNGTMDQVTESLFDATGEAVTLCISLISILVFWLGIMKIAQKSGLLKKLSMLCKPIVKLLFPEVPADHAAMGYMLSNMIANLFGLGNAATPMGIKAMEQLKELNGGKTTASRSMITFLAINNSCITLVPTTIIAIRMTYQSASSTEIVVPTIIATTLTAISALISDRLFYLNEKRKERK